MSRLIVNADDLGYTPGINRAIVTLHVAGALSSATMMASGQALLGLPLTLPTTLDIGCHIVLVDGRSVAEPSTIPSLLAGKEFQNSHSSNKQFRPTLSHFVADLLRGRILDREIEVEAVAQIRSLQALGMRVTHIDTHKHTHMFPRVLRPLLRAALQCGVRAIRNPFEPDWSRATTKHASLVRRAEVRLLGIYRKNFIQEVRHAGMRTSTGALGVLATGVLDMRVLEALLSALERNGSLGSGTSDPCYELVCHPGFHDAALDAQQTRLRAARETERKALLQAIPQWTGTGGPHRLVSFAGL